MPHRSKKTPPEVILVLNSGASFVEFEIFRMAREQRWLAKGSVGKIGSPDSFLTYQRYDGHEIKESLPVADINTAMHLLLQRAISPHFGVLSSVSEIDAVGHRVVHGGEKFVKSTLITVEVKKYIYACASLAPLHNPANLAGIAACEKELPNVPNIAVFDTAFNQSMPPASYLYAIPYDYYSKYAIRKYGFHGCYHHFAAEATAQFLGKKIKELKLITCHLDKGCSMAAIDRGTVLDNSMGMTPLPGLVMDTRCGDIDPAVVLYLANQGMSADEIDSLLNTQSGLLGVAGIGSSDINDIVDAASRDNDQATRAVWIFIHRVVSYIGGYYTLLGGADAIVFTGKIGESNPYIRSRIVSRLGVLGCHLNETKNHVVGRAEIISDDISTVKAIIMPTNEALMIARETLDVLKEK